MLWWELGQNINQIGKPTFYDKQLLFLTLPQKRSFLVKNNLRDETKKYQFISIYQHGTLKYNF